MVGAKTLLLRYSETIKRLNSDQEEIGAQRYVGLFFAFDIVNSSAYKTLNYNGWSKVIISLLNKIQQSVAKAIPDAQIWRVLGDELVYFVPIKEKEDFRNYTEIIFETLCKMVHLLKTGAFFDEIKVLGEGKELMKMQNIISLKSAAWIAIVGDGIDNLEQYDNVIEKYKFRENYGRFSRK